MLKLGTVKNSKPFFSRKWITSYNGTSFVANDINTSELTEQWQQMLDSDAASRWTLIKGQISKLLVFDINIGGHSKTTFNVEEFKPIFTFALWKKLPDFSNSKQSSFW